MKSVTTVLEDWLVAQGMHDRAAGTAMVMVNGDGERSRESALSHQTAMREGGPLPMGMEKTGAAKAPASVVGGDQVLEPSPARGRPVLRLIIGGSSKPSRAGKAQLRLVLVQ